MSKAKMYKPEAPHTYMGNQVFINSDRLVFQSKKDSILMFADKAMSFSTNGSIHFDTNPNDPLNSKFVVSAGQIILGLKKSGKKGGGLEEPTEPALKGEATTEWLAELLETLEFLCMSILASPKNIDAAGHGPGGELVKALEQNMVKERIDVLREELGYKKDSSGNYEKENDPITGRMKRSKIASERLYIV